MILNIPNEIDLSGFYIIYDNVVANETDGSYGLSHMIEHLMCKNMNESFVDDMEKNGIIWNAYTTPNNIVFYIRGLDDYVYKFKDEFYKKITNLNIEKELLESEKRVILEEYSDLFNRYCKNHFLNLYRKLFNNYNSIGRKSDIQNATVDNCYNHYSKFYNHPSNIVYISKKYKHESDIAFNDIFSKKSFEYIDNNTYELENPISSNSKSSVIYVSPVIKDDFFKIILINYFLSGGLKSPLYRAIREKENISYYINCRLDRLQESGIILISTETNSNNVEKLHNTISNVFNDKSYLTREKFDVVKNFIKISMIKSNINLQDNEDKFIIPPNWRIENYIDSITYEDFVECFEKYFNIDTFYKSVDKTEFF
jgi:predicted Zn-dependent peptidase